MKPTVLSLGTTLFSLLLLASSIAAPPPAPQHLRPAWLTIIHASPSAEPFVIWEPVAEAESYSVYRADDVNTNWTLVASNLTVPFFGDSLAALLPSYYTVTAVNADGEGPGADPVSVFEAYGGSVIFPGPSVENRTLTSSNAFVAWATSWMEGDEALLQWGPLDPLSTNYPFYLVNTNYLPWQSFELTNLTPLTPYQYRVTSISGNRGGLQWDGVFMTPDTNHPPVATFTVFPFGDGTNWFVGLSATDDDAYFYPAIQMNTFRITSQPTNGMLIGTLEGQWYPAQADLIYQAVYQARGIDHFTFVANDGLLDSIPVTVVISNWVNTPPVVNDSLMTTPEDTALNVTLSAFDAEGDPVSFTIFGSWGGTLTGNAPDLIFTPDPNFSGSAGVSYMATDGYENSYATVSITVEPVNDPPVVEPLSVTTLEDSPVFIMPVFSDSDTSLFTTALVAPPTNGTLVEFDFGFLYHPAPNFSGADNFTFVLVDADDGSTSAVFTASIAVQPVNDLPQPNSQTIFTGEDTPADVVLSATDAEDDSIAFTLTRSPAYGTLTGNGASFVYTPVANFNGTDSFDFIASDFEGNLGTATIIIEVASANDVPVANSANVVTAEDAAVAVTLSASDADGDLLSYSIVEPPAHGTLSGTPPDVTYQPAANYNGPDAFTFTVNDGTTNSNAATFSISITPVNDTPVANPQSVNVTYNTPKAITLAGSDVEASALSFNIVAGPTNGILAGTAPNLTYTPNVGSAGLDQFTFTVNDGASSSAGATVSITTQGPVAVPAAPSALTVTVPASPGTLNLAWNDNSTNEDGFKIERSGNGSSGWTQIATVGMNVQTFSNTGLAKNARYYYRVRAFNQLGDSAYSNSANGRAR